MTTKYNLAVLGATGVVGETVLEILAKRKFPVQNVFALASERSVGSTVLFGNKVLDVLDVKDFDFAQADLAIFSAGAKVSAMYAPKAAAAGCVVIDNTSHFRNDPDVPLIIPEVNPESIADYKQRNIIANPNCSTIQMLVALKPIYDAVGIKKITVATYQSVSGTGRAAISELIAQSMSLLNGKPVVAEVYPRQIAFNVIPQIDEFMDNGYTREEMKMLWETRKIMHDPNIIVNATTVRVPVVYGHSEVVTIETKTPLVAAVARELLQASPGVKVIDDFKNGKYPTPIDDAVGNDPVYVGRIRNGIDDDHTLNMWVVSDNIRKGAALNSVQIVELLIEKYLS